MKDLTKTELLNQQPSTPLTEEKLQDYLNGSLSLQEQHEVEQWLSTEGMESDALDGLQTINSIDTNHIVHRANHILKKQIKNHRTKRSMKGIEWSWIAVVIILLLGIAAYLMMQLLLKK